MPRLENWSVTSRVSDPYKAPEQGYQVLQGEVYGHLRFPDGECVITSRLEAVTEDGQVITRSGSIYELGVVADEYEKLYPNAKNRLIESIQGNVNTEAE